MKRYDKSMINDGIKPLRTYHVNWTVKGARGTLGKLIIDAPNEREARREAKRHFDAWSVGGTIYRITYVVDAKAEAEQAKALVDYNSIDPVERAAAEGASDHANGFGLDACSYPSDSSERAAWIDAWKESENANNDRSVKPK
jgi:ribosome modulation factor